MDYDATDLPDQYDQGRSHGPAVLDLWMSTLAQHLEGASVSSILDLGCGTGRFCEALATHFDAGVVGVDPSTKMIGHAKRKQAKGRVHYAIGLAEAIPMASNSMDVIFMSMVFHHFHEPRLVAGECFRVRRREAPVFLRAGALDRVPTYPYVPFFPTSVPLLRERLPPVSHMREVFEAIGFRTEAVGLVEQEIAPSYAAYADKLAAGGDSILASLTSEAFDTGMRALRAHATRVDPQAVTEQIDVLVFR